MGGVRDGKRDPQGGKKREKKGKIMQHCTIFCKQKKCKEAGANKYRAGTGIRGYGKQKV